MPATTVLLPRLRRWARLPRDEYALSPATASGRVRGRPTGPRTRTLSGTGMNCRPSATCPAARTDASGRHVRSAARWTLLVCPPQERRRSAAFSRRSCDYRLPKSLMWAWGRPLHRPVAAMGQQCFDRSVTRGAWLPWPRTHLRVGCQSRREWVPKRARTTTADSAGLCSPTAGPGRRCPSASPRPQDTCHCAC